KTLTLTSVEREVLLWGLTVLDRPEHNQIIEVLSRLTDAEITQLRSDAQNWAGPDKDELVRNLERALFEAQAQKEASSPSGLSAQGIPRDASSDIMLLERVLSFDELRNKDAENIVYKLWDTLHRELLEYPKLYEKIIGEFMSNVPANAMPRYSREFTDWGDKVPRTPLSSRYNDLTFILKEVLKNAYDAIVAQRQLDPTLLGEVKITIRILDNDFVIEISDNGCGIADSILEKIFLQEITSYKTKNAGYKGGEGKGLKMTAEKAKKHNLKISIHTKNSDTPSAKQIQYLADTTRETNVILRNDRETRGTTVNISLPIVRDLLQTTKPGGVDLRKMEIKMESSQEHKNIRTQKYQSTSASAHQFADNEPRITNNSLSGEWQQIENMIQSGIIPSTERIKEYLQSCSQKQDFDKEIDKVISCIAEILRLEEEKALPTEKELKEILMLLESNQSDNQINTALKTIIIPAKQLIK
ncbi:MAG: ATP-binding protein, partial [Candidatus Omnitrophota bacterium]